MSDLYDTVLFLKKMRIVFQITSVLFFIHPVFLLLITRFSMLFCYPDGVPGIEHYLRIESIHCSKLLVVIYGTHDIDTFFFLLHSSFLQPSFNVQPSFVRPPLNVLMQL